VITSHGKTIARIVPNRQDDKRDAALKRLTALRGKMLVGDVLVPLNEEWTGDTDNLQEVKQQQDLRGQVDIADNWQALRELEINK
jgi:antitoxin (DNA-binding transcriptional repressor) of toxin-antitoxin stability system